MEYRLPGADTNPYMTLAFVLGAGLHGIETDLELPPSLASAVGSDAGKAITTTSNNTIVGSQAYIEGTGNENTCMGAYAGYNLTTAHYNTALGYQALYTEDTQGQLVALGRHALYTNNGGTENTALGYITRDGRDRISVSPME